MTIKAVLFDVGGPLNTETTHERLVDQGIRSALGTHGIAVTDEQYEQASDWAVNAYVADVHPAILWKLTRGDATLGRTIHDAIWKQAGGAIPFDLRPGIPELLARLAETGLRLGLAANQPVSTIAVLDQLGIGQYFSHRQVSETHGFRKPDLRLFLSACDELQVHPNECIMVGDRIDNDISPAASLGMSTIHFRTGRHRNQRPRSWQEVPDEVVETVDELEAALRHLVGF